MPGVIEKAGFVHEHHEDHELSQRVTELLSADAIDAAAVNTAFTAWKDYFLKHIAHEESVCWVLSE